MNEAGFSVNLATCFVSEQKLFCNFLQAQAHQYLEDLSWKTTNIPRLNSIDVSFLDDMLTPRTKDSKNLVDTH